jgi:uncharacterized protein YbjT (DUF2867 family)
VPVTELRAAVIIGSGSVSFEMLRYLTEVLPAMVTPSLVQTRCQPIAIRDVLTYLVECLDDQRGDHPATISRPEQQRAIVNATAAVLNDLAVVGD